MSKSVKTEWFLEDDEIQFSINGKGKRKIGNYALCQILNDYESENARLKKELEEKEEELKLCNRAFTLSKEKKSE